jgi:site-specific DNA-methyltransferase (adenine-specific)
MHGAAAAHYMTMKDSEICKIPVAKWTEENAVLFLWATWPKLKEALEVMESWGFKYVTSIPWIKTVASTQNISRGVGFWSQGASEILMIGTKGKLARERVPVIGLLENEPPQFYSPKTRHSEKPLELHDWIEAAFTSVKGEVQKVRMLELFARKPRDGWTTWGGELGFFLSEQGVKYEPPKPKPMPLIDFMERTVKPAREQP